VRKLEYQQGLLEETPDELDPLSLLGAAATGISRKAGGLLGELLTPSTLEAPTFVRGPEREQNFANWFGSSKMVDEFGEPLVFYHGSPKAFKAFKLGGSQQRTPEEALEWFRDRLSSNRNIPLHSWRMGSFFTPKPEYASSYADSNGGVVYPVNLKAENPAWYDNVEKTYRLTNPNKTPDALIIHHDKDINEVIVPQPNQAKSIYNRGTYSLEDDDLLGMLRRGSNNNV